MSEIKRGTLVRLSPEGIAQFPKRSHARGIVRSTPKLGKSICVLWNDLRCVIYYHPKFLECASDSLCIPPPGTPTGTVCVLSAEGWTPHDKDRVEFKATWREGDRWDCDDCKGLSVRKATLCGFRFVRIASDPHA